MVVNRKPTGTVKSMPVGLALGWTAAMLMTAAACGLLAWLILSGKAGWEAMGYGAMAILLAASYAGAAVSCRMIMHRKLLVCILSGVIYLCSLTAITALMFGGKLDAVWVTALLVAGGTATAALVHCAEKRGNGRKRKKHRL
ncbi:MAG: hypothetical protein ACI3XG_00905 [Faecousia sp.]